MLNLQPNDILLYRPKRGSLFSWLICIKTWHQISHVELYAGDQQSFASRDGIGVDKYPLRLSELRYVLRPVVKLDNVAAGKYFDRLQGTGYGWLDLLQFVGLQISGPGIVCSPFVAGYLRAAGWMVFPEDPIEKVAPFQFLDLVGSECQVIYDLKNGSAGLDTRQRREAA